MAARKLDKRKLFMLLALALLAAGVVLAVSFIEKSGIAPRTLAPYIAKRTSGHNPAIVGAGTFVATQLTSFDRGDSLPAPTLRLNLGAQPGGVATRPAPGAREIMVGSADEARQALGDAHAGDIITFLPGRYRFTGKGVPARGTGRADAPILVRALAPGSVTLELETVEGILVTGPWWRFENLTIEGVGGDDNYCEHAFHVVGRAFHFAALNNTITNFNAHFKINGDNGHFPDGGLIESNTLSNTRGRRTANPVTPIDLVAASGWMVRHNIISDFIKEQGDQVSYGGFFKGAGKQNIFESNLVWCEHKLQGRPGQRVGLSLGGGGTGKPYCRDQRCIAEQERGELRANLIVACSDVGIYLNSAAASVVNDNTLIDTSGIDVRFASTSANVDGNLVDGGIRTRNGALLREGDNRTSFVSYAYLGMHPQRGLLRDPLAADFTWQGTPPARNVDRMTRRTGVRLCGPASSLNAYGAFDDFAACRVSATTASSSAAN
ncbi:right-handed parallel beta-helix repeat-containing protein [Massilia sp. S19_KUP03_FR1]|uniref:right-handed parallel beta-helix repeat-containing protein n=1 Tax=Massilia sp. S19_KUP03_FR1 TaxID=3025503 RepID=UPI002FCDB8CB